MELGISDYTLILKIGRYLNSITTKLNEQKGTVSWYKIEKYTSGSPITLIFRINLVSFYFILSTITFMSNKKIWRKKLLQDIKIYSLSPLPPNSIFVKFWKLYHDLHNLAYITVKLFKYGYFIILKLLKMYILLILSRTP